MPSHTASLPAPRDHTAAEVKTLLEELGMSQIAAAAALGVGDRSMRRYCAGECPHSIWLALCQLRDLRIRWGLAVPANMA